VSLTYINYIMTLLVIAALLRSPRGRSLRLLATALVGLAAVSCPSAPLIADAAGRGDVRAAPAIEALPIGELDDMPYADSGVAEAAKGDAPRLGTIVPLAPEPMEPFFEALDAMERAGRGLVRILHYGDSHTAADLLTAELRHALQDRFGDGGRGFVHLGRPWKTYRPKDVELTTSRGDWRAERIMLSVDPSQLDGRYGLGGVCSIASRAGAFVRIETARDGAYGRSAASFDVFYMVQRGGGTFDVLLDGRRVGTVSTAGAGPRSGFFEAQGAPGAHALEVRLRGDEEVRLFGVAVEGGGPGVVYDNLGLNGAFFYTPLRWDAALLAEQIERRDPDLIIAMYGSNEVDSRSITPESYRADVRRVMVRLRDDANEASCLMIGPPDRRPRDPVAGSQRLSWIIGVQRDVAEELGCGFVDLQAMMGGPGSQEEFLRTGLGQRDGVHLTSKGYRILGERLAGEIIGAYETWRGGERPGEAKSGGER
jgi:lysophospholipase L1-like esterase